MRIWILIGCLLFAVAACDKTGNKFAAMKTDQGGIVEFPRWPPLARGVAGYNLYVSEKQSGPFDKLNEEPITGGTMMVPHLKYGTDYWFYLTSVGENGVESRPGSAFKRSVPKQAAAATPGAK